MATSLKTVCFLLIALAQFTYSKDIGQNSAESTQNIVNDQLIFAHTVNNFFKPLINFESFECVVSFKFWFFASLKLCRHGDRNIHSSFPNDPWKSLEHWPGGYASLTNVSSTFVYFHIFLMKNNFVHLIFIFN